MIRMDMSEYMEKSAVTRLTGPPPGFVGYEEGGQLTEAVRRRPHSVVLIDEMEKAHGDVLNILLQILEDGILTDGQGRTVSFKNTVLVLTSNIGSKRILELVQKANDGAAVGDKRTDPKASYAVLSGAVKSELEAGFKPEFLNRIDDIVIFEPLTDDELSLIASMMILDIVARSKMERNLDITVSGALLEKMVLDGSKAASQFGARPMRRTVQRIFEDTISEAVVEGFLVEGDVAVFDLRDSDGDSTIVVVSRERDSETFTVEIEDSTRDIVAIAPVPVETAPVVREEDTTNGAGPEYLIASE